MNIKKEGDCYVKSCQQPIKLLPMEKLNFSEQLTTQLPSELLHLISTFLDVKSYNNLSISNKEWSKICFENKNFWKENFFRTKNYTKSNSQTWREAYIHYFFYMDLLRKKILKVEENLQEPCSISSYEPDIKEEQLIFEIKPKISIDLESSKNAYIESEKFFSCENVDETYIKKSMFRYEKFLELKFKYPENLLIPTQDIEMVWYSHLLRPSRYDKDCQKNFKKMIDHKTSLNDYEISMKFESVLETKKLWENEFGIPYFTKMYNEKKIEKYYRLSPYATTVVDERDSSTFEYCLGVHDFELDPKYEFKFSISTNDIMKDLKFLKNDSRREFESCYYAFWDILVKNKDNIEQYSPDHQIDIYWHSHMLHPIEYSKDCLNSFGFVLDHITDEKKFKIIVDKGDYGEFNVEIKKKI